MKDFKRTTYANLRGSRLVWLVFVEREEAAGVVGHCQLARRGNGRRVHFLDAEHIESALLPWDKFTFYDSEPFGRKAAKNRK